MSTPRTIEFFFDYACPYAYLASTQVDALAARTGAALTYKPMLLGGLFAANAQPQNLAATLSPAKAAHNARDMHRWAQYFGVEFAMPAAHPMRTVEALRATLATGVDPKVVHALFRAYWVEGRDVTSREVLASVLDGAGHNGAAIVARLDEPALKDELRARTDEALSHGIFGAPSFWVDGERLYWGQDRMHLVEGSREPFTAALAPTGSAAGRTVALYWDFSSPFAYLASTQAEALAKRTGAAIEWRPMLLGGLFRLVGQQDVPLFSWPASKQRYVGKDLDDWAAHWGIEFKFPSLFPMNSLKAMRLYLALPEAQRAGYRERTFRAYWVQGRDIADESVLRELVGEGADEALARTQLPEVKQALLDATKSAAEAGVFGAPAWVLDDGELFWGQDRLPLVERALRSK